MAAVMGWTPPLHCALSNLSDIPRRRPCSPASSTTSRTSRASSGSKSSRRGGKACRRHRENSHYIPRPRNAFIIFRCQFAKLNSRPGPRVRRTRKPNDTPPKTLSKRASEAWSGLSCAEKEGYKVQAEIERNNHALSYPGYRFTPRRSEKASKRRSPISDDDEPSVEHKPRRKDDPGRPMELPIPKPPPVVVDVPRPLSWNAASPVPTESDSGSPLDNFGVHTFFPPVDYEHITSYLSNIEVESWQNYAQYPQVSGNLDFGEVYYDNDIPISSYTSLGEANLYVC